MSEPHLNPPVAKRVPMVHTEHGIERPDPYFWMRERDHPDVLDYLTAENQYLEHKMAPLKELRETLFQEMKGRMPQRDDSVPYSKGGYLYYHRFEEGQEHARYYRKPIDGGQEQLLLDVNEEGKDQPYVQEIGLSVSPNGEWLAYGLDRVGRRQYQLFVKHIDTDRVLEQSIDDTDGNYVWAADNATLFFERKHPETLRTCRVYRVNALNLESPMEVYYEADETFYCQLDKSRDGQVIFIHSLSTQTSESRFVFADKPSADFHLVQHRTKDVLYYPTHREGLFWILTNWQALNFRVMTAKLDHSGMEHWNEVIEHRPEVLIESIEPFADVFVFQERHQGQQRLRIFPMHQQAPADHFVPLSEQAFSIWLDANPEHQTQVLRFGYTSLTRPVSTMEYHLKTGEIKVLKEQEVVGGHLPEAYYSERVWAKSQDGTQVPISLVYKKELFKKGTNPCLLYGYGSYGISLDPWFSSARLSLLDRGWVFAIAHVRGGQELGRQWYESGKKHQKKNTFLDFIACGEALIEQGFSAAGHLHAMGGSAGGLLMGACLNMRPDLWKSVVAQVPFVDVVTTMLDDSIPLTTGEYDEWGNPNDPAYFGSMLEYSPYDQVRQAAYPHILVTTGYHDSQVQYWEPAKWVARFRELNAGMPQLLFYTDLNSGHGGQSGRFERLKELALEYAFLIGRG